MVEWEIDRLKRGNEVDIYSSEIESMDLDTETEWPSTDIVLQSFGF